MLSRLLFLLCVMLVAATAVAANDLTMTITLNKDDLQRRFDRMFPITHEETITRVTLSQPAVLLKQGSDRIGLRVRIDGIFAQEFKGSGVASLDGKLRFESTRGELYLDDPQLTELTVQNVVPIYQEFLRHAAQVGMQELLAHQPIYVLGQMGESKRILGSELKGVKVEDGQVLLELAMP
ncbi:MAG: DUF1439 domain-containing protein [Pseudomonadota bacterium]